MFAMFVLFPQRVGEPNGLPELWKVLEVAAFIAITFLPLLLFLIEGTPYIPYGNSNVYEHKICYHNRASDKRTGQSDKMEDVAMAANVEDVEDR